MFEDDLLALPQVITTLYYLTSSTHLRKKKIIQPLHCLFYHLQKFFLSL